MRAKSVAELNNSLECIRLVKYIYMYKKVSFLFSKGECILVERMDRVKPMDRLVIC